VENRTVQTRRPVGAVC